jgi:hypothetical protein
LLGLRGIPGTGWDEAKIQREKQLDHASAGGDEDHHIVKVCIVVDTLDPGRIRRARIRQRAKRGDRQQKAWKKRKREPTTTCDEVIQHGLWISSPPHFVKQLRLLLEPECRPGRSGGTPDDHHIPPRPRRAIGSSGLRGAQRSTASSVPRRPCAYNWLRGPATTEIDSPHLRGGGRLTGEPARSCLRSLPPASTGGNSVGTEVRIWWENGNRTGFPRSHHQTSAGRTELEGFGRLFEPVFQSRPRFRYVTQLVGQPSPLKSATRLKHAIRPLAPSGGSGD